MAQPLTCHLSPAPVVTTPAPPVSSTVAGEGLNCYTTQECEVGCCYGPDGQLLDMSTYGPGGPKEYQGMCNLLKVKHQR